MLQLKHIKVSRAILPLAFSMPATYSDKPLVLANLETLSNVQDLEMKKHFFERILNVKKLGIHYSTIIPPVFFDAHLQKLEKLKILFDSPTQSTFLQSITSSTRLTLERGRIGWEDMTIFGVLPNLEVLKLREFALTGPVWEPNEGEFLNLKFLQIWETDLEQWRAESSHFPRLEHLIISKCSKLVEIPSGIGDIATLGIIEIDYASSLAVQSAKNILEEQQSNMGNDNLQVIFHQTKERLHPSKFGVNIIKPSSCGKTKVILKLKLRNAREKTKAFEAMLKCEVQVWV